MILSVSAQGSERGGTVREEAPARRLLDARHDPAPVEIVNPEARSPLLLVCEHAGRAVPRALGRLGLSPREMALHIAWDIGAGALARLLARRFGCMLILQRYSRLVIDCNRPPGIAQSIPEASDGIAVPANRNLAPADRARREAEIFAPYAEACAAAVARPEVRFAYAIHSFTPVLGGRARPWDLGFLYRHPASGGAALVDLARRAWPGLVIGDNEPYRVEDDTDWFVPACAEPRGIPHALVEVRNDHLLSAAGRRLWAERLGTLLATFMDRHDASHA
ncbi:MAG: N-formylglutamate amidohydrolase [Rhodobacteraceae bacterium]|nr:N-formylglutamate amidohydrolase [Paracoccaceae bacterium]